MPIVDPSFLTTGPEWSVGGASGAAAPKTGGGSFASALGDQLGKLDELQSAAGDASRALADGTATDPTAAVVSVERAQLAMQLASQLRTKGVEALQDIFHTQV
jgi:flagellar hook-basal body complex protein FliE